MDLYFIRHGQTNTNLVNKLTGREDDSLNITGRRQVHKLSPHIDTTVTYFFSSPARRAQETSSILSNEYSIDPRLSEQDWGDFSGRTWCEVYSQYGTHMRELEQIGWNWRPPGGESFREVFDRSDQFILSLQSSGVRTAICVTHLHTISILLYDILKLVPRIQSPFHIDNASVFHIRQINSAREIIKVNWIPTLSKT